MSFIRKILGLSSHKAQKKKSNAANQEKNTGTSRGSDGLYKDRFHYEHREKDGYREIYFSGKEINFREVQICIALLLDQSRKGCGISRNDEYSRYYDGRYGIKNINKLHQWLLDNGYLRSATLDEVLGLYKVSELKDILENFGEKKTGKKTDLIDRIKSVLPDSEKDRISKSCKSLFLSEKGEKLLEENYDFVLFHRCQYDISIDEFFKNRMVADLKRTFNDTAFQVLSQRAYSYQIKKYFSQLEMIYHNLSNICYEEGKKDLALQYELYWMYFSSNLSTRTYLFDEEFVRLNKVENLKFRIDSPTIFNQYMLNRIIELRGYFTEQMLDVVYSPEILPYCLFGKRDMSEVIQDLYGNNFNAEKYINLIRANYGNYVKKCFSTSP